MQSTKQRILAIVERHFPAADPKMTLQNNGADSLVVQEILLDVEDVLRVEIPRQWLADHTIDVWAQRVANLAE
jgi:acyl carrier protein